MRLRSENGRPTSWWMILTLCATAALIALLTGCASVGPDTSTELQIYQPSYLELDAGTMIATSRGKYTTQIDEVWVSLELYETLERQLIAAVLEKEKLEARLDLILADAR